MRVRKAFDLSGASVDENRVAGLASVYGVLDRSIERDVIAPGAFAESVAGFMAHGFVPDGHNWSDFASIVAFPTKLEDRPEGLYLEATFHSTPKAQAARTVAMERMAAGLSVGLSVAFDIGESETYASGAHMIDALELSGRLDERYDAQSIRAHDGPCRLITRVSELYEVSLVTVPANPAALATSVKGTTLCDELDAALAAVETVAARLSEVSRLREAEGRRPSPQTVARAKALRDALSQVADAPDPRRYVIERAKALLALQAP